jgi:predicted phosphate transport protein (TIGR00153 family)
MISLFKKLLPREDGFFLLFERHTATVVGAANAMKSLLAGEGDLEGHCQRIIALEDEADDITRDVLQAVRRSFITPFDRGDIKDLIQSLDDAIDMMHKTVKTIRLYEQTSFEPGMREIGVMIAECARLISEAIPLLNKIGANAHRLTEIAEEVMRVEGRSDEFYEKGLKDLYKRYGKTDPMAYIIGSEIYGELEKVVDRFEDVANEISGIVIENV